MGQVAGLLFSDLLTANRAKHEPWSCPFLKTHLLVDDPPLFHPWHTCEPRQSRQSQCWWGHPRSFSQTPESYPPGTTERRLSPGAPGRVALGKSPNLSDQRSSCEQWEEHSSLSRGLTDGQYGNPRGVLTPPLRPQGWAAPGLHTRPRACVPLLLCLRPLSCVTGA